MVTDEMREKAEMMLFELQTNRLVVDLAPSMIPECAEKGGKIRVVMEQNALWYRDFCNRYPSNRTKPRIRKTHDTAIKRKLTVDALRKIINGRCDGVYVQRLIDFMESKNKPFDFEFVYPPGFDFEIKK